MDSIIPLGQKNTLVEYMILFGVDNRPPMLDKDLYDSWKSRMELYMQNREHGRMILESIENGPVIWPTIEENGVTRTKTYAESSVVEKIQANCNMKATNIILQGLAVPVFYPGDDPIACLNKEMAFLTVVASLRQCTQPKRPRNAEWYKDKAMLAAAQEAGQILDEEQIAFLVDPWVPDCQAVQTIILNNAAFQTKDLDTYYSDCDDISNAKVVLMANISNYGSNVISEETQQANVQDTNLHAQQDSVILSVIEQMSKQMINHRSYGSIQRTTYTLGVMAPSKEPHTPTPKELPKVILVNESLKKLKLHLANFDKVMKIQTTPNAQTEEYFQNNDLKAQLQDKDTTICKLKEIIKSMRENSKEENVSYDYYDIKIKNVELENSMVKLLLENERLCREIDHVKHERLCREIDHVKQVFKERFDSIKKTRVCNKEHSDSLTDKLNLKSAENKDLKAQIQDKTQEQDDILRGIVEQAKVKQPLDNALDFACKHAQRIHALMRLNLVRKRLLSHPKIMSRKLGSKCSTSNCGSKPTGNKRNDMISQTPSRNMKKNVEAQPRKVNKKNCVVEPIPDVDVKHSLLNATSIYATWNHPQLMNFVSKFLGTVRFENDHIARIMMYGDYQLGNVTISKVYYVEGFGHNLFSVGQFCDADLEVAFWKNTCFVHNLKGVDLISGSRDINLYIISLDNMLKTSSICLLSKASKTKSWLWHRWLSHLNFVRLNATVRNVRTDNGTKIFNQTLREFYENVGISHQTSVACTPQQNGVVERRNRTLVEAARTMLIFSKAPLFLWAEAITTACYTQNRSLIRLRYNKTSYELMQDKKPDLSFFYVFGKLDAKADIGIFVGYAPAKKAFIIYNKRTQKIIETIHVTFDELTAMASEQFSSGPRLHFMTPATSCSRLVPNIISQQPCIPPNIDDWDHLFQPMFDEYFNPSTIVVSLVPIVAAPRDVDLADLPMSTLIDQVDPSPSIPSTQEQEHSSIISQGFEESPKTSHFHDDPLNKSLHEDSTSQGSSSNVRPIHTLFESLGRWTKDHLISNVIRYPSRSVSTR
nr:integrase, catalytic region, zinc finger, CCHC-type, peptidase aspartic, catalytic [Tanacetum cinerariifolium]